MTTDGTRAAEGPSTGLRITLGFVALVVLLYSVVIATRPLLGVSFVVVLFGVSHLWRFLALASRLVSAVERIADAMEDSDDVTANRSSHADSPSK